MDSPSVAGAARTAVPSFKGERIVLPRQPAVPDPDDNIAVNEWLASQRRPWAVDLFAGAGGLSLGLQEAGFSVVASADDDATALETHAHNVEGLTWLGDLADARGFLNQLGAWGIDRVELVAGGPPCQPFSRAGRPKIRSLVRGGQREANDLRSNLWRSFFAVVEALDPSIVLLENVPEFAHVQEGAILLEFMSKLTGLGFKPYAQVLEAWRYEVPQHRQRLFVVAVRPEFSFDWPQPSVKRVSLWDAIGDLPAVPGAQRSEVLTYHSTQKSSLTRWLRRGLDHRERRLVRDHITRDVRPDDAEIFHLLAPGQTYKDVPERLQRYRADIFDDKYFRLTKEGLSRSITAHLAKDGYGFIHPERDGTLSVREAARVQTFPDVFRFAGHPTVRFKQIGNAVPPLLAKAIGSSIIQSLASETVLATSQSSPNAFREPLQKWHRRSKRRFPWRRLRKPWKILLAEMCLRRTRANQVADVYGDLVDAAPTPRHLLANRERVRSLLSHLGLNWRADNVIDLAEALKDDYSNSVPGTWGDLVSLPGIGKYVASAVLCFSFGQPAILVDTNTSRIARRLTGQKNLSPWEIRLILYELSGDKGPDAVWNYMLLDLAALVCTPRSPSCTECPVQAQCATGEKIMAKRTSPTKRHGTA